MDRTLAVRTPESISFSYELAGLGSRFLALSVDLLIQLLVVLGIVVGVVIAAVHLPPATKSTPAEDRLAASIGYALVAFILFLVFFGYFIAFEAFWNGQTPGKKLLAIRVVRDGGYPLDIGASFIRNLIRIGEFALGFYAVGAIACLVSPENKRLGDMAAGTIVVRDARAQSLAALRQSAEDDGRFTALLTDDEHALIARFIARRRSMDRQHRRSMASQIADRVRKRVSSDLQKLDDEDLLERLNASS